MYSKSRLIAALGLVLALALAGVAFATGASENTEFVDGKVSPSKLDKKKYKPVNFTTGLHNEGNVPLSANPTREVLSYGKNIKINPNAGDLCTVSLANGTPTAAAKAQCPPGSFLGSGEAEAQAPGNVVVARPVVSAFHGPTKNQVIIHTYSPDLATASPVFTAKFVKSTAGPQYEWALDVNPTPETGALLLTRFFATIEKSSKLITARCKAKKFLFARKATYKDGSTGESDVLTQPCKRK